MNVIKGVKREKVFSSEEVCNLGAANIQKKMLSFSS
jgi:hypothetical protein